MTEPAPAPRSALDPVAAPVRAAVGLRPLHRRGAGRVPRGDAAVRPRHRRRLRAGAGGRRRCRRRRWGGPGACRAGSRSSSCTSGLLTALGVFFTLFLPRLSSDFARLFREAPPFFQRVKKQYVPRVDAWLDANFPREEEGTAPGAAPPVEEVEPRPERKLRVTEIKPGQFEISLEGLQLELDPDRPRPLRRRAALGRRRAPRAADRDADPGGARRRERAARHHRLRAALPRRRHQRVRLVHPDLHGRRVSSHRRRPRHGLSCARWCRRSTATPSTTSCARSIAACRASSAASSSSAWSTRS